MLKFINKDYRKFFELSDILLEIEVVKDNVEYFILFVYFDIFLGILLIVNKFLYVF